MNTKVILITGKAQSGKDTTGDFLMKHINAFEESRRLVESVFERKYVPDSCEKYSFATALKNIAVELFDIPRNQVWGSNAEKDQLTHIKWADLKNVIGIGDDKDWFEKVYRISPDTEFMTGRQFLQFFGSEIIRKLYGNAWVSRTFKDIVQQAPVYAFVCDVRFKNEIDFFIEKGIDPIVVRLERNPLDMQHISETALDDYDWKKLKHYYPIPNQNWTWEEKDAYLRNVILPVILAK